MTGCIGLIGLLGIAVFIALLFVRRKKIESGMTDFYEAYSLYTTTDAPPNVRESLGESDNLYSCKANLITATGEQIEFYWWEWNIKSTTTVNGVPSASYSYYLAVSFAPNSVSDEFIEKTMRIAARTDASASQKFKDFFVLNTETPYHAEKLADGTFVIRWHILKHRDVYEAKIAWLKNTVTLPFDPTTNLLEEIHSLLPVEPKTSEPPSESKTVEVTFYTHDDYRTLKQKFNAAWTNLSLEIHHSGHKLWKEGYDEFDGNATFAEAHSPNVALFTLTNETITETAMSLFSTNFGGEVFILRDNVSVENKESLAYCNNPFRLPLNVFTYGEFKRRFAEHWTNLGIELYDTSPHNGGLWTNNREFADDFEMMNLKNADRAFLHDYAYISDWGNLLKNVQVAAAFRNDALNVYCEDNLRNLRLREFDELKNV